MAYLYLAVLIVHLCIDRTALGLVIAIVGVVNGDARFFYGSQFSVGQRGFQVVAGYVKLVEFYFLTAGFCRNFLEGNGFQAIALND